MKEPRVEYPCWWTYAIIGPDEESLRLAVGSIVQGKQHRVDFSRLSAHKRYASLHVEVWVESESVRDQLFDGFLTHPAVRMVL